MFSLRNFIFGALLGLFFLAPTLVLINTAPPKEEISPSAKNRLVNPLVSSPSVLATTSAQTGVPILMYHYIGHNPEPENDPARTLLSTTPEEFKKQLQWLFDNEYKTITLNTLHATLNSDLPRPEKMIVITFDDGYEDFYTNAFPILKSFHFHTVQFIPTGLIGKKGYLTWQQIKQINSTGLVDFEAHTVSHVPLLQLSPAQVLSEIKTSKEALEENLGRKVNFLSYPFGNSTPEIWKVAQQAGFIGAVGTWQAKAKKVDFNMPRMRVNGGISLLEFEGLLTQH